MKREPIDLGYVRAKVERKELLGWREADDMAYELSRLRGALRAIVNHWDEFGPEYGFDEVLGCARGAVQLDVDAETGTADDKLPAAPMIGVNR